MKIFVKSMSARLSFAIASLFCFKKLRYITTNILRAGTLSPPPHDKHTGKCQLWGKLCLCQMSMFIHLLPDITRFT